MAGERTQQMGLRTSNEVMNSKVVSYTRVPLGPPDSIAKVGVGTKAGGGRAHCGGTSCFAR